MAQPTDRPCPAFGIGCGGFLNADGVCTTCGAVVKSRADLIDEVIDEVFETDVELEESDYLSDASQDALADDAAERHYSRTDFDPFDGFPYPR